MAKQAIKQEEKKDVLMFEVEKKALLEGLTRVCGVVQKKASVPMLENVLVEIHDGQMEITGTDLEVMVSTAVTINDLSSNAGKFATPGKKFLEIVKELTGTLRLTLAGDFLTISTLSGKFELVAYQAEEFPVIEDRPGESYSVSASILRSVIDRTLYAVCTDEIRVALCGLHLEGTKERLVATCTDGHRMSRVEVTNPGDGIFPELKKEGIIIPRRGASEIRKLLEGENVVEFSVTDKNVIVDAGDTVLYARLIDAQYPDITQVIPSQEEIEEISKGACSKVDLIDTLRRVQVLSKENRCLKLAMYDGSIKVFAENPDIGQAEDKVEAVTVGLAACFGVNSKFLIEALEHINSEEVEIKVMDETAPIQIVGAQAGHLSIVMPMRA